MCWGLRGKEGGPRGSGLVYDPGLSTSHPTRLQHILGREECNTRIWIRLTVTVTATVTVTVTITVAAIVVVMIAAAVAVAVEARGYHATSIGASMEGTGHVEGGAMSVVYA